MIDKKFNARFVTFKSPNYYILMNNIIDCNITAEDARNVLKVKYPALDKLVDDAEWDRMLRMYELRCCVYRNLPAKFNALTEAHTDLAQPS